MNYLLSLGLFTGCSIALVAAIMVSLHFRALLDPEERTKYMESIFQLYRYLFSHFQNIKTIITFLFFIFMLLIKNFNSYNLFECSLFGFIVLHMVMYGVDTFLWRRYRVNYPFIFGFKPGTELGFREVLLLASGLSVLSLAAVLSNLDMEMEPNTKEYSTLTELVPLTLVCVRSLFTWRVIHMSIVLVQIINSWMFHLQAVFVITICPFNIIYRSSRYFLLHCAWHCVCAPLYKVLKSTYTNRQDMKKLRKFTSILTSCLPVYVGHSSWFLLGRSVNKSGL